MVICRTCLSAENLCNIFEKFNSTQINSATGITVQENDGLPQMICKSCKNMLTSALKLREQSLYAERVLLEELNSCIKQENLHRDESTDSESVIANFRQTNSLRTKRKTKIKFNQKSNFITTNSTPSQRNMCKNENVKSSFKRNVKCSNFIKDRDQNLKMDIKIENSSELSDLQDQTPNGDSYDNFLQEIAQLPNPKDTSSLNEQEELKQMYKIIDQELERSKTKYKSKINLKEVLNKDDILNFLSPDLKCLLTDNSVDKSQENEQTLKRPYTKSHNKTKLAKLWALAVKPIDRSKLVQCSVCPKLFKYKYFLRHASTHLDREFTCEVCGSKFVHVYALRYHQQRKHGAVRKHACAQCDYTAVQKEELLNHENRVHTGLRPFICDACGDGFSQRRTLVQHMRKHYGVKRHRCEFCDKLFASMSQLGAHRKQYHLMRYTFLCYLCPYQSTDRHTVRRHLLRVHGIARHEQQAIRLLKEKR